MVQTEKAQATQRLEVKAERLNGFVRLFAIGELDFRTAPVVESVLANLQTAGAIIFVDIERLTFVDIAGIESIERARESAVRGGGALAVVSCPERIRPLFESTDTDHLLQNEPVFQLIDAGDSAWMPIPIAKPAPEIVDIRDRRDTA